MKKDAVINKKQHSEKKKPKTKSKQTWNIFRRMQHKQNVNLLKNYQRISTDKFPVFPHVPTIYIPIIFKIKKTTTNKQKPKQFLESKLVSFFYVWTQELLERPFKKAMTVDILNLYEKDFVLTKKKKTRSNIDYNG